METFYLGLGANTNNRRKTLGKAVQELTKNGVRNIRLSPVYETRALLPNNAPNDWDIPYVNLVLEGQTSQNPHDFLTLCKQIEAQFGRDLAAPHWSPRPLDIDILLWGTQNINTPQLTIPHAGITHRAFVLDPLSYLAPSLKINGKTVQHWARQHPQHQPLWFGILNITPDSFSNDGLQNHSTLQTTLETWCSEGVPVLDIGAESTRPNAQPLTAVEEWQRLQPVFDILQDQKHDPLRAKISMDTYHPETARKALDFGVDIINDVSGLTHPAMIELAASSSATFIAMHNLGVPADKAKILDPATPPIDQIKAWLTTQKHIWETAGIGLDHLVFDVGVGFGKNAAQSMEILRHIEQFNDTGLRLMVGHSRKSFMNTFTDKPFAERDFESIGASLQLGHRGVDMLRVHNAPAHMRAWKGWNQTG